MATQRYKALELAFNKEQVDLQFVMDYVLHLKDDINQEMTLKGIPDTKS